MYNFFSICIHIFDFEVFKVGFKMGNDGPPHLSPNLHFNLQIKMQKRNSRSQMGLLNTLQTSGFHDMANVETWKCAICKQYDPVGPSGATTEWVGCDCNRWYHQFCTGLDTVDDSFSCKLVKLKCLPME